MLTIVMHVLAVLGAVMVTSTALAHLFELPGKKRLGRADYLVVQKIYYPGFTLAGTLEVPTVGLLLVSTVLTRFGGIDFWLCAIATLAFASVHAAYWLRVHAVNRVWLSDEELTNAAARFFSAGHTHPSDSEPWTGLRDRWEHGWAQPPRGTRQRRPDRRRRSPRLTADQRHSGSSKSARAPDWLRTGTPGQEGQIALGWDTMTIKRIHPYALVKIAPRRASS